MKPLNRQQCDRAAKCLTMATCAVMGTMLWFSTPEISIKRMAVVLVIISLAHITLLAYDPD